MEKPTPELNFRVKYRLFFIGHSGNPYIPFLEFEDRDEDLERICEQKCKEIGHISGVADRIIESMPYSREVGMLRAHNPTHAQGKARTQIELMLSTDKHHSWDYHQKNYRLDIGEAIQMSPLNIYVYQAVQERFNGENYEFLLKHFEPSFLSEHGIGPDATTKPKPMPPIQGGGGPLIDYRKGFSQQVSPLILDAVRDDAEAQIAMDLIFKHIERKKVPVADGDHHSYSYGEEIYVGYFISTSEAFALAKNKDKLRSLIQERLSPQDSNK